MQDLAPDQAETLRLIRAAGRKAAITFGVHPDDVVQDLWILYDTKLASLYTPTLPLYPLLAEAARRIALGLTHRRYHEVTQSDIAEREGEDLIADLVSDDDPAAEADRAIALAQLGKMLTPAERGSPDLALGRFAGTPNWADGANAIVPRRQKQPRAERILSPNQMRLREIRLRLNKTLGDFAMTIGISEASQRAYEYAVTRDVPPDVMERAEHLAESVATQCDRARPAILDIPIEDLIQTWADLRGVPADPPVLADALGNIVSGNTLRRWLAKKHRPAEKNLLAVDGYARYGALYPVVDKTKTLWRMVASCGGPDGNCIVPEETFLKLSGELVKLAVADGYISDSSREASQLLKELEQAGGGFAGGAMILSTEAFSPFAERMRKSIFWQV